MVFYLVMQEEIKMTNEFKLPGAEKFASFLKLKVKGVLTAEGPQVVDRSYNGKYAQKWVVKLDGEQLGEYFTFGPKPGEMEFGREFRGRVPGHVNGCVAIGNKFRPEGERIPEDTVSLVYADQRFEAQLMSEGLGRLVDTPWQRQDFNDIPFP